MNMDQVTKNEVEREAAAKWARKQVMPFFNDHNHARWDAVIREDIFPQYWYEFTQEDVTRAITFLQDEFLDAVDDVLRMELDE